MAISCPDKSSDLHITSYPCLTVKDNQQTSSSIGILLFFLLADDYAHCLTDFIYSKKTFIVASRIIILIVCIIVVCSRSQIAS
jgi:hypothetical protein